MNYKKIRVAIVVLAVLIGSFFVAFYMVNTKPSTPMRKVQKGLIGVRTMVAKYDDHVVTIEYPGRVMSRNVVTLTSEVNGKILPTDVVLKSGGAFKKGDVIVRLFSEDAQVRLAAEKSLFLNTLAQALPDIRIDLPEEFNKWLGFFNAVELDAALPDLPSIDSDKEKIYISSKSILSTYFNIKETEIILTRYVIEAPFNGVFTSVNFEVGSIARMGSTIANITSTDMLEMAIGVFLNDAQNLNIGTQVAIISQSGKRYMGRVSRISPFVDPTTQRINVYVSFYEPGLDVVEGQMLMVLMPSRDLKGCVEVSREAVVDDASVYVVADSRLKVAPIELVYFTATHSYIRGVESGTVLVNESLVSPYDGMGVLILPKDTKELK